MKDNHIRNMFEFMKKHGHWKQYQSFEDYRRATYRIGEEDLDEIERQEKHEDWKNEMPEQERLDFEEIFEN